MKFQKTLAVVVFGAAAMAQSALALDLLGSLNKASEAANKVSAQAQAVNTSAQSLSAGASLQTVAAQQLLTNALSSQLEEGTTTKADLISLLGEPVKSKVKGKTQTLTYSAESVAAQLETAQAIAAAMGVNTPDISGAVNVVLQGDTVQSFNVADFLVK
jgi:hypothetical protein